MASRLSPAKAEQGSRRSGLYWLFVLSFLAAVVGVFSINPLALQSLRLMVFDGYQRMAPAPQLDNSPVVIVAIDEDSLARQGQWPWPRSTMAELTRAIGAAGARAIAFDVMFAEPDRTSPEQMLHWLSPEQASDIGGAVAQWPTHDALFAQAIADHPVVLAATLQTAPTSQEIPVKAGMVIAGDNPAAFAPSFPGFSASLPVLTEAARGVGAINWQPDRDQVVRRVPLLFSQGSAIAPSLALEALRVAEGESTIMVRASNAHGAAAFGQQAGINQVRMGAHAIPTDARGAVWIHFRHSDPRGYVPAWRVLSGEVDPAQLSGKIVLIGASAPGLMDLRATPLDAALPGVEVHQQILEQMLADRYLTRPDLAPAIELLAALLSILLLAFAAPRLSAGSGAVTGAAVIALIWGASMYAFQQWGLLFDPVFPSACAFLFGAGSAFYLYRRMEVQRAEIRRAFSQYVSPGVVKQLVAHPEQLRLGGQVRDLTLMFCDVRNFTGISEKLDAEELTSFINRLLTPLTDVIISRGGTIDKYMGDAVMAFWNAPLDDPEHARRACEAAVLMSAGMADLNKQWRAEAQAAGKPFNDVAIGIGVNSGECCVGNLGSMQRFDYSAIGDNVNITSRLEGLTKAYGLPIIVGEDTATRLPDLPFLEIDQVRVKGRSAPLRIFTLLSVVGWPQGSEPLRHEHDLFLGAYRRGNWPEAHARLGALRGGDVRGLAPLYATFAQRLEALANTDAAAWDGVYDQKEK